MCVIHHQHVKARVGVKTEPYAFLRDESLTEPFWGKKANSVLRCALVHLHLITAFNGMWC